MSGFFTVLLWVIGVFAFIGVLTGLVILWLGEDVSLAARFGWTVAATILIAGLATLFNNAISAEDYSRHCGPGTTYTEYYHDDATDWVCQVPR